MLIKPCQGKKTELQGSLSRYLFLTIL